MPLEGVSPRAPDEDAYEFAERRRLERIAAAKVAARERKQHIETHHPDMAAFIADITAAFPGAKLAEFEDSTLKYEREPGREAGCVTVQTSPMQPHGPSAGWVLVAKPKTKVREKKGGGSSGRGPLKALAGESSKR